jgi:type I restriction enzyme, S subunit
VMRADLPCLLLQRVARFQLDSSKIDGGYLYLWVHSDQFSAQIVPGRSNGVPHISSKQVEAAKLFLPSLPEQRRIVARAHELAILCDSLESQAANRQNAVNRLLGAFTRGSAATV